MSCCAARGRRGERSRFTRREILRGTPAILLATLAGCTVRRDAAELPPVTQPPVQVVQPPRFAPTPTPPPTRAAATTATAAPAQALHGAISFASWGSPNTFRALEAALEAFRKAEPGIEVIARLDNAPSSDAARTELSAGTASDVVRVAPEDVFDFTAGGLVLPLDDLAARDLDMDEFVPALREARPGPGGELGALSLGARYLVMFYNRWHIEAAGVEVPTSWADAWSVTEFEQTARRMVLADEDRTDRFGFAAVPWIVRPLLASAAGGDPKGEFFNAGELRSTMAIDPHVRALKRIASWRTLLGFELGIDGRFSAPFNGGLVPFYVDATDFASSIRPGVPWEAAPLPGWSGGALTEGQELCVAVSGQSSSPEAAWRLARFMLGPEAQQALAREDVVVPFRREVLRGPAFLDPNRRPTDRTVWADAIDWDLRTPSNPGAKAWHTVTGPAVNAVRDGSQAAEDYLVAADALITRQLRARGWSSARNVAGYRQELPLGNALLSGGDAPDGDQGT